MMLPNPVVKSPDVFVKLLCCVMLDDGLAVVRLRELNFELLYA
jgi:hypothetical protein